MDGGCLKFGAVLNDLWVVFPRFGDPFVGFPMLGIIKDYGIWVCMGIPAFMETIR